MYIRILNIILIVLCAGCTNPFSTRDPEKPVQDENTSVFVSPIEKEFVMENFKHAIEQQNLEEYMNCFIQNDENSKHNFHFEPDPYLKNDFITGWALDDERNFFNQLKSQFSRIYFSFDTLFQYSDITVGVQDSVETDRRGYVLTLVEKDSVSEYRGQARFKLYRATSTTDLWYIYYWQDNAVNNEYTKSWSYLKLSLAQRR